MLVSVTRPNTSGTSDSTLDKAITGAHDKTMCMSADMYVNGLDILLRKLPYRA